MVFIRQQLLAPLAFRQESFVVLLSITPLPDGVLQLDIIAPFHTSGPPLLQFHLDIEQWGYQTVHGTNPVTYDLPIPFEEAPFTVAISTGNSGNHASCGGFTKTTIVLRAGTTAGVWDTVGFFIIGCQLQWGKILGDTVNLKIINFPVSFNECFGGLALFNGDPVAAAEYATITDITNTNFKIYMYANNAGTGYANANIFYLFLGAQPQWGMNIHGWVIFPIPFTKFRRLVTNHQGNVFMDSKARESNTLSGFTLDVADNSDQNKDAQWIAIGA